MAPQRVAFLTSTSPTFRPRAASACNPSTSQTPSLRIHPLRPNKSTPSLLSRRHQFFGHNPTNALHHFFGHPILANRTRRRPTSTLHIAAVAKGGEGGGDDVAQPNPADATPDFVSGTAAAAAAPANASIPADTAHEERPAWAPQWLPNFFVTIRKRPWLQLAILLPLYAVHLFFFSTKGWKFKKSVIPNEKNLFGSIGYDSIVGALVALVFLIWRRVFVKREPDAEPKPLLPSLLKVESPPWKVPREAKKRIGQTAVLLMVAYLASGYGAVFSEQILFLLAGSGVPLTTATTRAWKVLLGHLMWVYMGIRILRRLKPFFPPKGTWMRWKWKSNWVWWAIGGYYVSALFFNMADVLNQLILPASMFEEETVVSKLINPENKDRIAMAVGSIGPCVSAPVFEEVLYRGFLLPALACFFPMWVAIPASSVLFALHHLNPTMVLPLAMLGLIWAILYSKSRNLTVTILIHAMWNSRVFLGSLLGLGTFTDFE